MFSFVQLLRRWMTRRLRKPVAARPYRRPTLEGMEDRLVPSAANQAFVDGLYQSVLHHAPDPTAVPAYVQGLDQGEFTRFQAAEAFVNSPEGVRDAVQAAYQQFLHRATDPQGLSSSSSFLLGGGSLTALDVDLISSDEYFQVRGGTNAGFVNGLYQDALGRSAAGDPGRRHWSTLSALARAAGKRLPPSCRAWNTGRT